MPTKNAPAGSQSSLREANAARVLEAVKRYGRITQVELSAATGLAPATISNIVKQLASQGAVDLQSTIRSGRRAQLVTLARSSTLVAGLAIGRRSLRLCLADSSGSVDLRQTMPLPADHRIDATLDRAALLIMDLLESSAAGPDDLAGVGVTVPAPVDPATRRISLPGIMRGWEDVDIPEVLSARLGKGVIIENDANAAVIAENRLGALRGTSSCVYVRASYHTGAGILLDGRLHAGPGGIAGEIGHVVVSPTGPICACGSRGCLNTVVGADALVDLLRLSRGPMTLQDLLSGAINGDPGCRQVLVDAGTSIGAVLADAVIVTGVERVAVGGELMEAGELLLAPIREALTARPFARAAGVEVVASALGADAEPLGALSLAADEFIPTYALTS
ncbi:ROK family transcriptional regulator [Actinomyces sp. B33]|uniref:ROK family transcriptional regulator n=1 Tax=Actinomyces sp. B33 TaxID=2942131 RepID=UPI002340939A|nr:ROK family transcriptional regulator [Actinomyces sp. B33]MDC4233893.1 ROK family transcriptional regulator [Actinomyces sp. B33]